MKTLVLIVATLALANPVAAAEPVQSATTAQYQQQSVWQNAYRLFVHHAEAADAAFPRAIRHRIAPERFHGDPLHNLIDAVAKQASAARALAPIIGAQRADAFADALLAVQDDLVAAKSLKDLQAAQARYRATMPERAAILIEMQRLIPGLKP